MERVITNESPTSLQGIFFTFPKFVGGDIESKAIRFFSFYRFIPRVDDALSSVRRIFVRFLGSDPRGRKTGGMEKY